MKNLARKGLAMEKKLFTEFVSGSITVNDLLKKLYYLLVKMEEYILRGKYAIVDSHHVWIDRQGQFLLEESDIPYDVTNRSIDNMFKDFICSAVFLESENVEPVIAFLHYMDGCKYFNLVEARNYLKKIADISEEQPAEQKVSEQEPEQGETGVLGYEELSAMHLNKMADAAQADFQPKIVPDLSEYDNAGETGVLDESYWDNLEQHTVSSAAKKKTGCMLIRVKNNEQIPIQKEIFSVGKESESVDYVLDNPAVSRRHFDIISKGNHYFIVDNDSTNKTYVDGKPIPPKEAVEIKYGARIKAANEEFLFEVLR